MIDTLKKEIRNISETLSSIDVSLMQLANKDAKRTTAFVSKKVVAQRLGVASVAVDKLVFQGVTSKGKSGLVEGIHYTKLDPDENNPSKYLYDVHEILNAAWSNFQYD